MYSLLNRSIHWCPRSRLIAIKDLALLPAGKSTTASHLAAVVAALRPPYSNLDPDLPDQDYSKHGLHYLRGSYAINLAFAAAAAVQ